MRHLLAVLLLTVGPALALASPATALKAARDDARQLPPDEAHVTRYERLPDDPEDAFRVVAFWTNSLSDRSILTPPRVLKGGEVIALNLLKYDRVGKRWLEVWERLADVDPFWHTQFEWEDWGRRDEKGVWTHTKYVVKPLRSAVGNALVDYRDMAELVVLTGSAAPIVEADWWAAQVCRQINTEQQDKKIGYYEWLGIKDRKTFEKLAKFNERDSIEGDYEPRAILPKSGVSMQGRQIEFYRALWGIYSRTLDNNEGRGRANPIQNIKKGDYVHKAERHFAQASNGLFYYLLSDDKGVRQDVAPANVVGGDSTSGTNDAQIHVGLSCAVCHTKGLKPVPDWARKVGVKTPDIHLAEEFQRQYSSDLDGAIDEGNEKFARATQKCNGLTPPENAKLISTYFIRYVERDYFAADVAKRLGIKPEAFLRSLERYKAAADADPRLRPLDSAPRGWLALPPVAARVEHVEEAWSAILDVLARYPP